MNARTAAAAAALALLAAAALAGCTPSAPSADTIESVTFSQSQALPDFDDGEYTQDDPAEVQKFVDLLETYDIDPGGYQTPDTGGCAGGISSDVTVEYEKLAAQFSIDGCAAPDDTFEADATALLSGWRDDLGGVK